MDLIDQLVRIDPSKECLKFLSKRILSNNYRGIQLSQHNRYDVDIISTILTEIYNSVGLSPMRIRTTDLSKRPYNTPDETVYANFVNRLNGNLGRCTQDSVRKNLFVDINRMGLINRFDKNGNIVTPYEKKGIYSISLSSSGLEFINASKDIFKRNLLYTRAVDKLTHGLANELLDIVAINGKLSIYEFMFFISYMNCTCEYDNHTYTRGEMVDHMLEFRSMSHHQQQAAIRIVDLYCDPKRFSGDKLSKRDFHNWKNESQQIFMLMNQTVFYEERKGNLYIRVGDTGLFENENKLKRSLSQKNEYFKKHNITREVGFELHHIVPLLSARSRVEFQTLDVWENMIYIDGFTHSKINQTNNKNTRLSFEGDDVLLQDIAQIIDDIVCINKTNVLYDVKKKSIMKNYNQSIIATNTELCS